MHILIFDSNLATRAALLGRIQEAMRQVQMRRIDVIEAEIEKISEYDSAEVIGVLLGSGHYQDMGTHINKIKVTFPKAMAGIVLENETYASEAVFLRKNLEARIMPLGDLAQLASFVIDCDEHAHQNNPGHRNRGVLGIAQLKGGVGATTITAALAACWAKHGLSVCAIDYDDVNPQLTMWGRVSSAHRGLVAEFLRGGEIPASRLNEILYPVEGYGGQFVIVGQPERYNESFHFKADIFEGAPSAAEFVTSLITSLRNEFDVVLIDFGKSWGISTFATLPLCQQVLLVTDDDGMSVRCTLDNLQRLQQESEDPEEFDLGRWSMVLNAYTGQLINPKDLAREIREMDLLPEDCSLYTIPFSEHGRQWGAPGQSFYELAEEEVKEVIRKYAFNLVPFKYEEQDLNISGNFSKLLKKVQSLLPIN